MKKIILWISILFICINVNAKDEYFNSLKVDNKDVNCTERECEVEVLKNNVSLTFETTNLVKETNINSGYSINIEENGEVTLTLKLIDKSIDYHIYIRKHVPSDDATLKKIMVNDYEIETKEDVYVYSQDVKFDTEEVLIKGTPNDEYAKELNKEFLFPLESSSISLEFKAFSEDGSSKKYTIILRRLARPNTNLKTLTLNDIDFKFDPEIKEYNLDVPYKIESILLNAIPEDSKSTVQIEMEEKLIVGTNTVTVIVTNEEVEDKYILTINRLENIDPDLYKLDRLEIKDYNIKFNPDIEEYELIFKDIPDRLDIEYKNKENSDVKIVGNSKLTENSIIKINIFVKDKIIKTYLLNIKKDNNEKTLIIVLIIILSITMLVLFIKQISEKKKEKKNKKEINKNIDIDIEII